MRLARFRLTPPANRPLAGLVLADGISRFGDWIYLVALPVLVWERTGSAALVGLTVAGRLLPFLLLSVPAGALADRLPRTAILIAAESTCAGAMLVAAALCMTTSGALGIVLAAMVASAAGTIAMPAFLSLVPEVARTETELGRANAAMSTIDGLAGILGPALAGLLIVAGGLAAAFLINGLTFAVVALAAVALRRAQFAGPAPVPSDPAAVDAPDVAVAVSAADAPSHWAELLSAIAPQLCLDAAVSLVSAALGVLGVLVAVEIARAGTAFAGPLNAASGLGALAGAVLAARFVGSRTRRGSGVGVALIVVALVALAVPGAPSVALAAMAVLMSGLALLDTLNITAVQVAAGSAATGRAIGLLHSLAAAWMLLGTGIATSVAALAGAGAAVLVVAVVAAVLGGSGLALGRVQDARGSVRRPSVVAASDAVA